MSQNITQVGVLVITSINLGLVSVGFLYSVEIAQVTISGIFVTVIKTTKGVINL